MSKFFSEKLSHLVPYVPGEQPQGMENLIKLNTNENPFSPSPKVQRILSTFNADKLRRYNDPTAKDLLNALAYNYDVDVKNTFAGNGSDEVLALIFKAFCPFGASFADITYGFYSVLTGLNNIRANIVPLRKDYSLNVEDYEGTIYPVFIANPNAPTGMGLPVSDIEKLLNQDLNRLVVVDEAYVDFGTESCIPLIEKYDNLIVVGTFSKSRSLAGARLGFAFANEEIIKDLNSVKFSFHPYNINTLTQLVGKAAIEDTNYFKVCCNEVIALRNFTVSQLKMLGCTILPSSTNFVLVDPMVCSGEQYYLELRKRNILVRYFDTEKLKNFVRVTIGTSEEMQIFINATKEIIERGK